jgi:hypothetical protein
MLCKPKDKGGVGIVNFTKRNEALLLKHPNNFFNKADLPWFTSSGTLTMVILFHRPRSYVGLFGGGMFANTWMVI